MSPVDSIAVAAADPIAAVLHDAGISPTAQRVEIAAVLLDRPQHLSADQVIAQLSARGVAVSKATVYNTLGLLVERGLVREVTVDATKVFYDSNTSAHHHFFNVDDGTLTDFASAEISIERLPLAPSGTTTECVDVVIRVRNRA